LYAQLAPRFRVVEVNAGGCAAAADEVLICNALMPLCRFALGTTLVFARAVSFLAPICEQTR
jgi:hypothetical protein